MGGPFLAGDKALLQMEIRGWQEWQRKAEQMLRDLTNGSDAMVKAFRDCALLVERDAKLNLVAWRSPGGIGAAGVDTGRLRASITPDVRVQAPQIMGVVGSALLYAPYQELGTGVFVGRPPHFPPGSVLDVWAGRHGGPETGGGWAVAIAIGRRGGLRPLLYLQRALDKNKPRIIETLNKAFDDMCKK
jgi:hypothetical protein